MITSTEVAASRFTATRFREGYEVDAVDRFLALAGDSLRAHERNDGGSARVTAAQVVAARFQPTKYRRGYDQTPVDDLLDQIVEALRTYEARLPRIL